MGVERGVSRMGRVLGGEILGARKAGVLGMYGKWGVAFGERRWLLFSVGSEGLEARPGCTSQSRLFFEFVKLLCRTVSFWSRQLDFCFYKRQVEDGQPVMMSKRMHFQRR